MPLVEMKAALRGALRLIESRCSEESTPGVMQTGFKKLDSLTQGFRPGELVVVAGRPCMGKTVFCLNVAQRVSQWEGCPVAFYSLDCGRKEVARKMLAAAARVSLADIRRGQLVDEDRHSLFAAAGSLGNAKLFIDDAPGQTTRGIRQAVKGWQQDAERKLVIIDCLELLRKGGNNSQRCKDLKEMALETGSVVVLTSRIRRLIGERKHMRPVLTDLNIAGPALGRYVDTVLFLYRDNFYNPCSCPREACLCGARRAVEVIVSRCRGGAGGAVKLAFSCEYLRLEDPGNW